MDFLPNDERGALLSRKAIQFTPRTTPSDLAPMLTRIWLGPMLAITTCANLTGLRQFDVEILFLQQRLHGLVVVVLLFSLLYWLRSLGQAGLHSVLSLATPVKKNVRGIIQVIEEVCNPDNELQPMTCHMDKLGH